MKRCTQTGSRRNPTMESHPPTLHSKKTVCGTRLTKCIFVPKMHFASIYLLQKALFESLLCSKWAHFGHYLPYYGCQKSRKLLGNPPKPTKNASKSPKNGFWGHFGPFGAHFYPFYIEGIQNKNFDRFWVARCPFSPDWLATCPSDWLATYLQAKVPPPLLGQNYPPWGKTT